MAKVPKQLAEMAQECGRFSLLVHREKRLWAGEPNVIVPAHKSLLGGLVGARAEAYVYRGHPSREDASLFERYSQFLEKDRTRFRLNATIKDYLDLLPLWNARGWERGSIAFVCEPRNLKYEELFADCFGPSVTSNSGSGNNPAAFKLCRERAVAGNACVLLSASNGFDWAEVFMPPSQLRRAFKAAESVAHEIPPTEYQ
jgi:hypothetical protein